jgi:hypothetical protein
MNSINLSRPMQLSVNNIRFCIEYGAPEAKVAPPVVPPSAREPHRDSYPVRKEPTQAKLHRQDPALDVLPQHKHQLPSEECVFANKSGHRDFWNAQKHDPGHPKAGAIGTAGYPLMLTLGDLEDDEQKSCDKCVILARGIRSYMPSSNRTLRLHFSHRGTKLCCAVETDSGWALVLETTSEDCKSNYTALTVNEAASR